MGLSMIDQQTLLLELQLDPSNIHSHYYLEMDEQQLGYTIGPDSATLQIRRLWFFEITSATPSHPTAALIHHNSGGPWVCFDGGPYEPYDDIAYYENRYFPVETHWSQTYNGVPDTTYGDQGTFFSLASSGSDTELNGRKHEFYEASIDSHCPVFESEEDWERWRDAVNAYINDPNPVNLLTCKLALARSLNPAAPPDPDNPDDDEDPNDEDPTGPSGPGGGGGTHDPSSDVQPVPPLPSLNAVSTGFTSIYSVTEAILKLLASELNSDNVIQWIENFFDHPQDFLVGLGIIPFQPTLGNTVHPKLGANVLDTAMPLVGNQYQEINFGSLPVKEFWGSCFDYSPYTKVQIFLPYVGSRELDVDEVMGHTLGVIYHADVLSGDCIAFITVDGDVRYQYTGNLLQQVPLTASSYDNVIMSGVQLAAAAVGSIAAAGAAGAAAGEVANSESINTDTVSQAAGNAGGISLPGSALANVMTAKPHIERIGNVSCSAGQMGLQVPYLMFTVPRQSLPSDYKGFKGYPSNITANLSALTGYTEVSAIQLHGIAATDTELNEIVSLLKGGVYL